jgi:hypothetical protein
MHNRQNAIIMIDLTPQIITNEKKLLLNIKHTLVKQNITLIAQTI